MSLSHSDALAQCQRAVETFDLDQLDVSILTLCYTTKNGLTDELAVQKLPELTLEDIVGGINKLAGLGLVQLFRMGDRVSYKGVMVENKIKLEGLESEEVLVYQHIEATGNEGIWIKTLKLRTNLHQNVVTRCIKNLENRNLIKAVKSIKNPTRKAYMLWENTPSVEVTGGPWYSDQDLDVQFVKIMYDNCFKFIVSRSFPKDSKTAYGIGACFDDRYVGYPTAHQVHSFITSVQISNVELTLDHINQILDLLVYDGKVVKIMNGLASTPNYLNKIKKELNEDEDDDDEEGMLDWQFKAIYSEVNDQLEPEANPLMDIPCGPCPVSNVCHPTATINPASCEYFRDWLDF